MSYCIVDFQLPTGNEIAIAHRKWIDGDRCYWPSVGKDQKKLVKLLKAGANPDQATWIPFSGRIIGNKFYDSYEKARERLPRAEYGSDISSDEPSGSRRRQPSHKMPSSDSDSENDGPPITKKKRTETLLPPPPPVTIVPTETTTTSTPTLVSVQYDTEGGNLSQTGSSGFCITQPTSVFTWGNQESILTGSGRYATGYDQDDDFSSQIHGHSSSTPTSIFAPNIPGNQYRSERQSASVPSSSYNLRGLAATVANLQNDVAVISTKLDMGLDMLRTLLQAGQNRPTDLCDGTPIKIPLRSLEEFETLKERLLSDDNLIKSLASMLAVKGGNNPNQITYRIMSSLMTDELMSSFTMAGQKQGKRGFQHSVFMQIVCDAVRSSRNGSIASDKDIEKAVEYWIKKASTRIAATTKRINKQQEQSIANGND